MQIKAALLDMDGTVFDSKIDWVSLRGELGIPWDGRPILAQLQEAPPDVRERGLALLHATEKAGAENGELIPGAHELLGLLTHRAVRTALVTNNSRRSAEAVLRRCNLSFDLVLTRDDVPTKPEPTAFLHALKVFRVDPVEAVAIGDAHLDLIAAHRAGIDQIILIGTPARMIEHIPSNVAYHVAGDLVEARQILTHLLQGRAGG